MTPVVMANLQPVNMDTAEGHKSATYIHPLYCPATLTFDRPGPKLQPHHGASRSSRSKFTMLSCGNTDGALLKGSDRCIVQPGNGHNVPGQNGAWVGQNATRFLPRDAMRKRGHCCRPVSVRLSVCLSHWCIVSTRLKIS